MKVYSIPITWQSYKRYIVNAENITEAAEKALHQFLSEPDDSYLEDSLELDEQIIDEDYPNETIDFEELYKKL